MKRLITLSTTASIILLILSCCASVSLPIGKTEKDYIYENAVTLPIASKTVLDPEGTENQTEIDAVLDMVYGPYAGTKRVIFFGERHACAGNFVVLDRIFPYFVNNFGVSTYLSEKGVAEGYLIDRYLRTGEEKILSDIMEMVSSSAAYTADQAESFRRIRQLLISLPEDKQFRYIGIDIGHGLAAPVAAFYYIMNDIGGSPPAPLDSVPDMYESFQAEGFPVWNDSREQPIRDLITGLHQTLEGGTELQSYLGNTLDLAELIIDSAIAANTFYDTARADGYDAASSYREEAIMDHFTRHHLLSPLPDEEIYFGQWGGFHIHQQHLGENKTIAGMINAPDGPFPGEVLSTMIFYNNCRYRDRKTETAKPIYDRSGAFLGNIVDAAYTLIPFDKSGSPFREGLYFISGGESLPGVTTDYIQAGLLLQNSPAAGPYQ